MRYVVDKSFLHKRGGVWWYNRRIPKQYAHLDTRERIRMSLNTSSEDEAFALRDSLVEADSLYWFALSVAEDTGGPKGSQQVEAAHARYSSAKIRALAAGFQYRPLSVLVDKEPLDEVLHRLIEVRDRAGQNDKPKPKDAEALLGGAIEPKVRVSEALQIYFDEIALNEQIYKSDHQVYSWRKVKKASIAYFIEQVGDLEIEEITREQALKYKNWWASKMNPTDQRVKAITASTANRHIGNIRALYREYFKHIGREQQQNPFRNINFTVRIKKEVPAFEDNWVRSNILKPGALTGIRAELQLIVYMIIETGCRPSEIINLQPEDISLNCPVPFISIRSRSHGKAKREIKTVSSEREIPLVGVSLEAARRAGAVFPHYQDRNELFSANVMKAFRTRSLFPTEDHKVYSFRHSFEKRMQEANIDYGLRCLLMGHKTDRPAYGDGGSLSYRRDELLKIMHPFSGEIFEIFDVEHSAWALASSGTN